MKKPERYFFLSILALLFLSACGDLSEEAEKRINELRDKTESLDTLINKELDKVLALDSLINRESEKIMKLDSLIDESTFRLDSISRQMFELFEK